MSEKSVNGQNRNWGDPTDLSMREPTDSDGKKIPAWQNIPVCLAECLFNAVGLSSPLDGDRWVCLGQSVARPGRTLKNIDFKLSLVVFIFLLRMYGECMGKWRRLVSSFNKWGCHVVVRVCICIYVHMCGLKCWLDIFRWTTPTSNDDH